MNVEELAENLGLEEEEFLELIDLFIETSMSDLKDLQSAIESGKAENAVKAAHSIKGAAANLGLSEISEVAKKIEENACNGQLEGATKYALELQEQLDVVATAMKQ
jgi:HPt (histidine-containing phosphotransfer) domain-containing protein